MAVPTERTWVDGDDLDTTTLNGGVRDPITFLMERPTVQLRQTASQVVATSTFVALTFTTGEDIDSEGGHDTGSNTSRYVAQEDGWYQFSGAVSLEANTSGRRLCRWAKNGTEVSGSRIEIEVVTGGGDCIFSARTMLISLSAGDYVELHAWQSSGANRNTVVSAAELQSSMTGVWMRRL